MCDEDNNGSISKKELYKVLKMNITSDKAKVTIRRTVQEIYGKFNKKASGELSR